MRKLKYILLLLIAIGCTKEVEVLNPINAENVKKIAELQTQLSSLTSSLSGLQSQNQNLANERNSLQEQLSSLQSQLSTLEDTNASLESQIESLNIKVAELELAVAIDIGVQDGVYTLKEYSFKYIKDENDTVPSEIWQPNNKVFAIIKDKKQIKTTQDESVDVYGDSSNKVKFKKWVLRYGLLDIEVKPEFKDSIYVSNIGEIITEFSYNGGTIGFDGQLYDNVIIKYYYKWEKDISISSEEDVPAQTFLEINKFIRENSTVGTFSDSIYKNIDPFDPISLREGFILDAQRNGLDISYLRDEEITLETVDWNYGAAYGSPCQTGVIKVYREDTYEPIIYPLQNSALWVMFHEMGHSALNLAHNNISGDIMKGSSDFSLENLRDKTRRMFQNIEQISYDCGFATQKGGGTIIVD